MKAKTTPAVVGVAVALDNPGDGHPEDLGLSPDGERAPTTPETMSLPGLSLQQALRSPTFWMLTASLSLVMLGSTVIFVHQPEH